MYGTPSALPFETRFEVRNSMEYPENIDFSKLQDIADVDQCVMRGYLSHKMGHLVLDAIERAPDTSTLTTRILAYGTASSAIGLVAFNAQPIDIVPMFMLGCVLGWMQLVMARWTQVAASLFPFLAAFILTFTARLIGSIPINGHMRFCWTAVVQGPLANILPSYTVLVAAVELQGVNPRIGTLRLVAATAYSMLLTFGVHCAVVLSSKHLANVYREVAKSPRHVLTACAEI